MPPIYSKEWNRITIQVRGDHRQGRTSPCEHACPLGNGIQQMHTLIAAGETGKALARLHARNPFPGITGRVCPHPCETKCNRAEYDEPVAIHALERFAADTGHETRFIPLPASGKRVAVVGSGPAGLTAARFAALLTAADKLCIQYVASGHYARMETDTQGVSHLFPPESGAPDESSRLAALSPEVLARLILPLGDFAPEDVAEMAEDFKL